jgi:hypothetical protein
MTSSWREATTPAQLDAQVEDILSGLPLVIPSEFAQVPFDQAPEATPEESEGDDFDAYEYCVKVAVVGYSPVTVRVEEGEDIAMVMRRSLNIKEMFALVDALTGALRVMIENR